MYVSTYLYSYPSKHGITRLAAGGFSDEFKVRVEIKIELTQTRTPRPCSSEFGDAVGGHDQATLEMDLEAVIKRVWRCTWSDCTNLEAVIWRVWRYTWALL